MTRESIGWVVTEPQPRYPKPLPAFRLFAVLGAWQEEDVVAATVRNAILQGCERVYLVDNDSPDDTVAAACAAGATLARSFSSESYDENIRLQVMNDVVGEVSAAERVEHVWWLWLDADEFHHGPGNLTVREHISRLDERFRIVGARVFNHFPDRKPEYLPGFHPLDFQPLCEEFSVPHCSRGHWKHPLQRVDRHGPVLRSDIGFHRARTDGPVLLEPDTPVFLHHFQYRDEQVTRRRLGRLCTHENGGPPRIALTDRRWNGSGISRRFRSLDAVYARQWHLVDGLHRDAEELGVSPKLWREAFPGEDGGSVRWYSSSQIAASVEQWRRVEGAHVTTG